MPRPGPRSPSTKFSSAPTGRPSGRAPRWYPGAKVVAEVVGEGKEPKIYVFKFKRRKNYRRKTGHRQKYTEVRITDVTLG